MRPSILLSLPLLFAATPAAATQGFACRTTAPEGVTMSIVIGSLGVAGATLRERERALSTSGDNPALVVGQSWVDDRALLLDLLDPDHNRRVARLKVGLGGELESRHLSGWLEYGGRRSGIVCSPA